MIHKKLTFTFAQLLFVIAIAAAQDPTPVPVAPEEAPIPVAIKSKTPIPEQYQKLMGQFHRVPKERYSELGRDTVGIDGTKVIAEKPVRLELRFQPARKYCPRKKSKKSQANQESCQIRPPEVEQTLVVKRTYRIIDREKFVAFKKKVSGGAAGFIGTLMTLGLGPGAFLVGSHLHDKYTRKAEQKAKRTPTEFTKQEKEHFWHPLPLLP